MNYLEEQLTFRIPIARPCLSVLVQNRSFAYLGMQTSHSPRVGPKDQRNPFAFVGHAIVSSIEDFFQLQLGSPFPPD
jgi:hypothetical protein